MNPLSIDIETYSDIDIKLGTYKYVSSPSFRILLFAYSIDDEKVKVIDLEHGEKIPQNILDLLLDSSIVKSAYNAHFERLCLNKYLGIETQNWECTMIKAWSCGLNGGLASVGSAIGLSEDEAKMKEGKALIKKFCSPNTRKVNVTGDDEKDWEFFKDYCKRDVEVEIKIRKKLEKFPTTETEKRLYNLDQKINDIGIRLDIEMIQNAIKIDEECTKKATEDYIKITNMDNPNSLKDIKSFIKKVSGIEVNSITKGNIEELKEQFKKYPEIVKVLNIRSLLSKTSTAKYQMMRDVILPDERSRGNIQFFGANRTGRWAGRLIQVHNLPRNYIKDIENAKDLIKYGDYELLKMFYDDVPDTLSQCLRTAIIPEEGKKFIVSDFSAIEARVIAWFADENWVLDVFKTTGKIYEAAASRMFHVPVEDIKKGSDMRQRGKVATLALGYQGGVGALISMGALKMGIPEDELQGLVDAWRNANSNIVKFWYETDKAVKKAIQDKSIVRFANNKLKAFVKSGILFIQLPSGRSLAYARPRVEESKKFEGSTTILFSERNSAGTDWIDRETYGGTLVENIVQATARDILGESMMALDNLGYRLVMHVHDEVIIEIDKNKDVLKKVTEVMGQEISWAKGLPLRADGYECDFYMKD